MIDVITASFLGLGAVGAGGVILHYLGYIPKPYRDRLERTETTLAANLRALPGAMGLEVENALVRFYDRAAATQAQELEKAALSAKQSMVRMVGVDKQAAAKVSSLLGEAILGPALPILRHFAPGLADALEENPQLIDVVIQNPLFKKYVEPKIAAYLGGQQAQGETSSSNPFLKDLGT